jgi:carboxyvinyl-carboxyphosphonate phosphorylmutase
MTPTEKRNRLRAILRGDVCKSPATVWDALSARVAEAAGFECGLLSGSVSAATLLGAPDLALQTLSEFADQVRRITRASDLSLFVDADQGYGNALNAVRTVEELEHAGLAGLAIEDLVMPAHFGRHGKPELIAVEEALGKLKAALSARRDASLVIVARTAALKVEPIARVVERTRAYAASGVDALFLTGLEDLSDLDAVRAAVDIPIILGTARGISRSQAEARGVRFRLQGHAVLAVCAKAMYDTYTHFKGDGAPESLRSRMATPEEMARLMRAAEWQSRDDTYLN